MTFLYLGEACMAIFSPTLGFKGEHLSALGSQPKGLQFLRPKHPVAEIWETGHLNSVP